MKLRRVEASLIFGMIIVAMISCDWAKDKAKSTLNKTGEIVGKTGSEIADGVSKGVEESFANSVILSDDLGQSGVKMGKVMITSTDSTSDNILAAYLIFDKPFLGKITAKVMDVNGQEFGRASVTIDAKADDAGFYDFVFDKRTNIDRGDRVYLGR